MHGGGSIHERYATDEPAPTSSNRSFGLVFAAVFAIVGLWSLGDGFIRWWAVAVASAFLLISLVRPALLRPLNVLWMWVGRLLHMIVTPVLMAALFYLTVTPTALLMRALCKEPIPLGFEPRLKSYWIERRPPGPAPESMKNQF